MAAQKPAGGWMSGIVKEVVSGDTLRIASGSRLNAPEKRITLASLIAPKLGRRDAPGSDEAYAWESREFLRKLTVGKQCTFRVDYTLENIPGREFGSVFIKPKDENVALRVTSEGWAKVRQGGGSQSPYIEQLNALTEQAEAQKRGLFQQGGTAASRDNSALAAQDLLDQVGKGKPLPAVIEQVGNGAHLRVTLLDSLQSATVQVCGVQCPPIGRRAIQPEAGSQEAAQEAIPPQPFALEAKHFTETATLNREVRVLLQGVDKHDNLIGSVMYPSASKEGTDLDDLGLQLVEQGLAKIAEWGLQMMITGAQRLREAERRAKQSKTGIWHDYVPPASAGVKLSDDFSGTVVEVVSGDVICVKDSASGHERRVTLSSIKAPRMTTRDRPGEHLSREARELLRQKLIGKEVHVNMEYSRKVGGQPNGAAADRPTPLQSSGPERQMDFGSVHIKEKGDKQPKMTNIAGLLLSRGLASVVKHRTDDERSAHYEALLEAEQAGIRNKQGLHKKSAADANGTGFHVNDISLPGNASKARQHLAFLTRGKCSALVEHVLSGNRLKLYIEKEGIMLAFSPSGVRAPAKPQPAGNGRPAVTGEPFWEEALAFTRQNFLQREVDVEIETVDRGGSFLGTVTTKGNKPIDLGLALLSNGLAKLHPSFDPSRVAGGRDLVAAEEKAKEKRLKVWKDYVAVEARVAQNGDADEAVPSTSQEGQVSVTVTEMTDASAFFVQSVEERRVQWIADQLQTLDTGDSDGQPPKLKNGSLCLARFSADKQLYRARVEYADHSDPVCPTYHVTFIDFGNKEKVKATSVKTIDAGLSAVPAQAHAASLAYLKVKGLDDEVGSEAARVFAALTGNGKQLSATLVRGSFSSTQPLQVILSSDGDVTESVNAKLLEAGLARFASLKKGQALDSAAEALQKAEKAAKGGHEGMWQYGDPGDESDEEDVKPKNAWGRR